MDEYSDPAGNPFEMECEKCGETTVHNSHYRCLECFTFNGEHCDKCGHAVTETITTGDRGGGPDLCSRCYFDV